MLEQIHKYLRALSGTTLTCTGKRHTRHIRFSRDGWGNASRFHTITSPCNLQTQKYIITVCAAGLVRSERERERVCLSLSLSLCLGNSMSTGHCHLLVSGEWRGLGKHIVDRRAVRQVNELSGTDYSKGVNAKNRFALDTS